MNTFSLPTPSTLFKFTKLLVPVVVVAAVTVAAGNNLSFTWAFLTTTVTALGNNISLGAVLDTTPPTAPLFWVEEDTTAVQIDWQTAVDATQYKVYRSSDNVTYSEIATVAAPTLTYTDATVLTNQNWYYKVTALDAAANESPPGAIGGKWSGTKDIVIDDNAMNGDVNTSGSVAMTGAWNPYHVGMGGAAADILQNAVGGDNYSTLTSADETYSWTTTATLDGNYEVFAQYICDGSRGDARYDVYAGALKLTATPVVRDQSKPDGVSLPDCGTQDSTSVSGPVWVSLGTYDFTAANAKIELIAQAGEINILADAVAFHRLGDVSSTLSDVTVCKEDDSNNPLGSWRMVLHDPTELQTAAVYPSNANGALGGSTNQVTTTTGVLPTDDYVLMANGSFVYRGTPGATDSDANFSQRHPSDPVYGGAYVPWVDVTTFPNPNQGWLGVMVNGASTSWGGIYNPAHIYANGYPDYAGGSFNFTILDDQYGDNSGSVAVKLYHGWAQDTALPSGCTTFEDVPYGTYTLEEIGQQGWQYQSGDQGTVVVDGATETFTLVNEPEAVAPVTTLTVSNSPARDIDDRVVNGGFESDLSGWTASGQVSSVGGENGVTPFSSKMAKVTASSNDTTILSQSITNGGRGLRSLNFWYSFGASPTPDAGLMVFVGDEMVYQTWAADQVATSALTTNGWHFASVYVADQADKDTLHLAFYGGASGAASTVYLDNITTNATVVNHLGVFTLNSVRPATTKVIHYEYKVNGQVVSGSGPSGMTFSLSAQPDDYLVEYWAEGLDGGVEARRRFLVVYDDTAPENVSDLAIKKLDSGNYQMTFTAPGDATFGRAEEYDIRWSPTEITDATDWNALAVPNRVVSDSLPGTVRAPKSAGQAESLELSGITGDTFFVSLKSADAAHNWSGIARFSYPQLEPLSISQPDVDHVVLTLNGVEAYTKVTYTIAYTHDVDGQPVIDALSGAKEFSAQKSVATDALLLGTCSTGGAVCVSHMPVTDIEVAVVLSGPGVPDRTLTLHKEQL